MSTISITINDKKYNLNSGISVNEIIDKHIKSKVPIVLSKFNGNIVELSEKIYEDGTLIPMYITNTNALRCYERTLEFIMIVAVKSLYSNLNIIFDNSINKGIYGELQNNMEVTNDIILNVKNKMEEIINENKLIKKVNYSKEEALKLFKEKNMNYKLNLIKNLEIDNIDIYELNGIYDYLYGPLASYTGIVKLFSLIPYKKGFLLKYPNEDSPLKIDPLVKTDKLFNIFTETRRWNDLLDISFVESLNKKIENDEIIDIVRVSEALHEKKIAYIADMVNKRPSVKMILISGPSSSGKTTFSKRLSIQLRVNGYIPVQIGLDDYFKNREDTPKDEHGEYDFESIDALDVELFNKNLLNLMDMKEVEIPSYNFIIGKREWNGNKLKLPTNGILVIEGIHGLNEKLTSKIQMENKFKIYISALTQLNLDPHSAIHTSDVRIIRRLVRDRLTRGYSGEDTLKMFPSIKKGENKNIFPFQEKADVMFNSTLPYELSILKKYAIKELEKIDKNSDVYFTSIRLMNILKYFIDLEANMVPENSIIREFIGGSCFYKY